MKMGTKSVLFGAHAFWLHPWFVALAWWRLYGFPWDWRLWVAFFVHDLGYWGRPNMDGPEGEAHPFVGARIMAEVCGGNRQFQFTTAMAIPDLDPPETCPSGRWPEFVLFHSRFLAKRFNMTPSRLCIADKLAIALTPWWLYLPLVLLTSEIHEYRQKAAERRDLGEDTKGANAWNTHREWYRGVQDYMRDWVAEHQDGRPDTWTPDTREAQDETGVWR